MDEFVQLGKHCREFSDNGRGSFGDLQGDWDGLIVWMIGIGCLLSTNCDCESKERTDKSRRIGSSIGGWSG